MIRRLYFKSYLYSELSPRKKDFFAAAIVPCGCLLTVSCLFATFYFSWKVKKTVSCKSVLDYFSSFLPDVKWLLHNPANDQTMIPSCILMAASLHEAMPGYTMYSPGLPAASVCPAPYLWFCYLACCPISTGTTKPVLVQPRPPQPGTMLSPCYNRGAMEPLVTSFTRNTIHWSNNNWGVSENRVHSMYSYKG